MYYFLTSLRFIILWIIGLVISAVLSVVSTGIILPLLARFLVSTPWVPVSTEGQLMFYVALVVIGSGFILGMLIGGMQRWLLQMKFGGEFRWWVIVSILGAMLGVAGSVIIGLQLKDSASLYITEVTHLVKVRPPDIRTWALSNTLIFSLPIIGMSLLQTLVLRLYTRAAWLWVLAHIVSAVVFFTLLYTLVVSGAVFIFVGWLGVLITLAAPGIITGFTMLFLLLLIRTPWWPEE
ncbi:hypothetical protein G4Y79_03255 [Phototrophicus methaneseepsis]|uniref:Uncharacterized protein n=1 Tax=Phototrophicus methaneseepsis TaxID=2710758 RepID=A0A7S8IFE7_9CHLR|nr:hypothetical protein [Phototrophicus methaneseepsis]QPC83414.1 hypothetical protein G4Y79_03255 [Phototrophicus methaneseepsis]